MRIFAGTCESVRYFLKFLRLGPEKRPRKQSRNGKLFSALAKNEQRGFLKRGDKGDNGILGKACPKVAAQGCSYKAAPGKAEKEPEAFSCFLGALGAGALGTNLVYGCNENPKSRLQ